MTIKRLLILSVLCLLTLFSFGQDLPEPMFPKRFVNDFTRTFKPNEQIALEKKLKIFSDTASTQIAIVTVEDLNGYDPNDYAQRLAEKWGIGQKGKDNGVLILLKPKTGREKGQVAIAVGYGLEGVIPDAIASRIIRNEIIPEFQKGGYYSGIDKATTVLMGLAGGEYTADQYTKKAGSGFSFFWLFFLLVFFIIPLLGKRKNSFTTDHHGTAAGAAPFIFFGGFGSGRNNSDFGSFSGGGGSFGGFGGGSFGGGGASGSW